jgi:hypothetical protein
LLYQLVDSRCQQFLSRGLASLAEL